MRNANFTMRKAMLLLSCFAATLAARNAPAQTIDLSLNVFYANPGNAGSGGTWELVAKSSHSGISGVSALVSNITTAERAGPIGTVNGSDPAGFSWFFNNLNPLGFRNLSIGQVPLPPGNIGVGEEQTIFYGVGTLTNGAPNYPGKPAGTNSIGPAFATLTVPAMNNGIPWATGDAFSNPDWNTAARLVRGTFPAGITPSFFSGDGQMSTGNVFTSQGTSTSHGTVALAAITTIVRTNFNGTILLPDYNDNGEVDAADYVLWRNTLGDTGAGLAADGNNDGVVNQADYTLWRAHFGAVVPPGGGAALAGGATAAVPEPASMMLFVVGAVLAWPRRRRASWRVDSAAHRMKIV
jgi:hypothetical protein